MDDREIIQDIRDRLTRIEVVLEKMTVEDKLKMDGIEEKIKVCNHRLDDLENQNTWLWRAIVGGLIAGAIALLFK